MRTFFKILLAAALFISFGCNDSGDDSAVDAGSTDGDTDTDSDSDSDSDTDPDTTEGLDDCEIMEQSAGEAVSAYCADFVDDCCYCQCYAQDQLFTYDDQVCECVTDTDAEDTVCEGAYLEQAEACVADLDTCIANFVANAEVGCNMTPL